MATPQKNAVPVEHYRFQGEAFKDLNEKLSGNEGRPLSSIFASDMLAREWFDGKTNVLRRNAGGDITRTTFSDIRANFSDMSFLEFKNANAKDVMGPMGGNGKFPVFQNSRHIS